MENGLLIFASLKRAGAIRILFNPFPAQGYPAA